MEEFGPAMEDRTPPDPYTKGPSTKGSLYKGAVEWVKFSPSGSIDCGRCVATSVV